MTAQSPENRLTPVFATYRVQLTPRFGFASLRSRVGYLQRLGISTVYTSPILQAQSGSDHGYDVVDPTRLSADLGSNEEFDQLASAIREAGMNLLIDIVPNHMAARAENPWWTDLLRQGPDSPYASYFDVDWSSEPIRENLSDKVLLPILGKPYGDVLEDQEIRIVHESGVLRIEYYERKLPLNFSSYVRVFQEVRSRLIKRNEPEAAELIEPIILTLTEWDDPARESADSGEIERLQQRIRRLIEDYPSIEAALDRTLRILNGKRGEPESFDELDTILEEQSYRLSFWRNAAEEINYRRFFDITDLVSIRVTDPEVFTATHRLPLELIHEGKVRGLRLDHIDGLYDPARYLQMLGEQLESVDDATLVVSEKIVGPGEEMPSDFRYRGTTGYEFARDLDRLFVNPEGFERLEQSFQNLGDFEGGFRRIAREGKIRVIRDLFRGELSNFTRRFAQLTEEDRHAKDLPVSALEEALVQLTASLPVYRTYVRDGVILERDAELLERTVADAIEHIEEDASISALRFLHRILTLDTDDETQLQSWRRFTMRFQQFTGPIAAKGIEDTALYVYAPLVSLNEVGAEPELPEDPVAVFHEMNAHRLSTTRESLSATSTHDTKRGEDTRCRIHALSEIPEEWDRFRRRWGTVSESDTDAEPAPSEAERWFFLQNLAGTWPFEPADWDHFRNRLAEYVPKALREAKVHSHWTAIDEEWETATIRWVDGLLDDPTFREDMATLQEHLAPAGMINSLAMVVLKIASPGIPDIYQGSEMWNISLVDPDNRRPVDYELRRTMLDELQARLEAAGDEPLDLTDLLDQWHDGRIKLWTTWRALAARRNDPDLFLEGEYIPLETSGNGSEQIIAFARRFEARWAIAIAPRLRTTLPIDTLDDTRVMLPGNAPNRWTSVMTGAAVDGSDGIEVSRLLTRFPVDLLVGDVEPGSA